MRSIKNIVIAASAVAAVTGGLVLKHIEDKKAAEQKAAFEEAETETQSQQDEAGGADSAYIALHKRASDTADVLMDIRNQIAPISEEARGALIDNHHVDELKLTQWKDKLKKLRERIHSLSDEDRDVVGRVYPEFIGYTTKDLNWADRWISMIEKKKEA